MRILVAGRNAKVLAQAAGAFANDLTMVTATSKAAALALLEQQPFDLVLACEKLGDGSGLEVLSHVTVNSPNTLRIFAARPATLELLKGELGLFALFRTLPYPINFRQLWAAIHLARCCDTTGTAPVRLPQPLAPVRHVVLNREWGEPTLELPAPFADSPIATTSSPATVSPRPQPPIPSASAGSSNAPATVSPTTVPARIPETDAFRRALARRAEAMSRRQPSVSNESLRQLAHLSAARSPPPDRRVAMPLKRRTALFVGSGVFAAGAAAALSLFLIGSGHSMGRSAPPAVASLEHSIPQKILPWQATPPTSVTPPEQQPPAEINFVRNEPMPEATATDMEVQAEAASPVDAQTPLPSPFQQRPDPPEPPALGPDGRLLPQ